MKTILETKMEMVKRHRDFAECLNDSFNRIEENQKEFDDYNKEMEKGLSDFDKKDKEIEEDLKSLTKEIDQLLKDMGIE